jgi:large subunit ribosomal protein L9
MKIMLRQNVSHLGSLGEVVEVSEGYARNYLLPKGMGVIASLANEKLIEAERRRAEKKEAERKKSLAEAASYLNGKSITIQARATEDGTLYGSIGPAEIAQAVRTDHNTEIAEANVAVPEPYKKLGVYEVPLDFGQDVKAVMKLWVVGQ